MCLTTPETTLSSTNFTVLYGHRPLTCIPYNADSVRKALVSCLDATGRALRVPQLGGGRGMTCR
jgi:hypothetical protein